MNTIKIFLTQLKELVEYNVKYNYKDFGNLYLFALGLLYVSYQDLSVIVMLLRMTVILLMSAVPLAIIYLAIKQTHEIKTDKRRVKKYISKTVDKQK